MTGSVRNLAYATVAYADIFNFPLTAGELALWMIGNPSGPQQNMKGVKTIRRNDQVFYTLSNRSSIINTRLAHERLAVHKWKHAARIAGWFRFIPTVELVGVTGGLAMNNAKAADDIDLFFITSGGTLWFTRALVTTIAHIAGVRRTPKAIQVKDSVCLNMFMSSWALGLPQSERDLFAAHEVLQMRPLWIRHDAYKHFLTANAWTQYFLPQAWNDRLHTASSQTNVDINIFFTMYYSIFTACAMFVELFAKVAQLVYMHAHRTNEVIEPGVLRFHPRDARVWVKEKFALRLKKRKIPLDTIFYHR